jgi:hypothetical protein
MALIDEVTKIVLRNVKKLDTYPQMSNTASYKSDVDIWRHLENNVWGRDYNDIHGGFSKGNINSITNRITKNFDNIKMTNIRISTNATNMTLAKDHRDSIESKLENKSNVSHSHAGSDITNTLKGFALGGGTASIILIGVGAFLLLRSKALRKIL